MPQLLGPNGGPVRLFDRRCTLIIGREENSVQTQSAIRVSGLRVSFRIVKTDKPEPNDGQIQVWNLNAQHRALAELAGTKCILTAGYEGSEAQIFSGSVRYAQSFKEGADWVTKLELGDGHAGYRARVSHHFRPGTKFVDVAMEIGKKLVSDLGNLFERASQITEQFADGYTVHGSAATELTRLLEPHGVGWSIQDGRLEVLAPKEYLPGEGPLISADTGMVGSPTYGTAKKKDKARYLHVKSLILPEMRPGVAFEVKSRDVNGVFRCHKLAHVGDTYGPEWFTQIEALPRS